MNRKAISIELEFSSKETLVGTRLKLFEQVQTRCRILGLAVLCLIPYSVITG
jgi:hypothetical protein